MHPRETDVQVCVHDLSREPHVHSPPYVNYLVKNVPNKAIITTVLYKGSLYLNTYTYHPYISSLACHICRQDSPPACRVGGLPVTPPCSARRLGLEAEGRACAHDCQACKNNISCTCGGGDRDGRCSGDLSHKKKTSLPAGKKPCNLFGQSSCVFVFI